MSKLYVESHADHGDLALSSAEKRKQLDQQQLIKQKKLDSTTNLFGIANPSDPITQHFQRFPFDETISATFLGLKLDPMKLHLYRTACFFSLGFVWLVGRWIPQFLAWATMQPCPLVDAEFVLVENSFHQRELVRLQRTPLPSGTTMAGLLRASSPSDAPTSSPKPLSSAASRDYLQNELCILDYKCNRFLLDPSTGQFIATSDCPNAVSVESMDAASKGLPSALLDRQRLIFGQNVIDVARKPIPQLLLDVVLHPFNVFQIAGIIIWLTQDYELYAGVIFILTSISAITTLIENRMTTERMRKMARFECSVSVLRAGRWLRLRSPELLPGDLVMLSGDDDLDMFPFDGIILNGDALVDECLLTGESIPVVKEAVADEDELFAILNDPSIEPAHQIGLKSVLFSGTKLVRARARHNRPAVALVIRTGFLTAKGSLVQSILFPRPNSFRFYRDSMIFIGILSVIAALGFICSLISLIYLKPGLYYIITRTLDLITVVVPPALHTTMTIGTIFAIQRLKRVGIYCISPPRINVCSRINFMCFDKTGTLTEEGLDVLGVMPASQNRFGDFFTDRRQIPQASLNPEAPPLSQLMACCHSLQRVHRELIGDPLDLKMFEFSGWSMDDPHSLTADALQHSTNEDIVPTIVRPPGSSPTNFDALLASNAATKTTTQAGARRPPAEIAIIKCFEFSAALRRMSVICRMACLTSPDASASSSDMAVLCKGSPESIQSICLPDTIPAEYNSAMAEYAHQGYRVLACAGKYLRSFSWARAQKIPRESVESELCFLGFIIFENKLKLQTAPVISVLHAARITTIMCTGDNVLTAVCVSRACGIVPRNSLIFIPSLTTNGDASKAIAWECVDDKRTVLDQQSLTPLTFSNAPVVLACTGDVLDTILERMSPEWISRLLSSCRIFARMSPAQKQILVELFQKQKNLNGHADVCIGFCGDGANDCGALRAADVGISLSQAEASVAAPFTSKVADIRCVVNVIQEGRASLVTSFAAFKYMALYSMTQFTSLVFLYSYASTLADWQFVYVDLLMVLPLGLLMTRFETSKQLASEPPNARLISPEVIVSILGQTAIQAVIQATGYLFTVRLEGHSPPVVMPKSANIESAENTSIFFLSTFIYVTLSLVYSSGRPHRRSWYWPFYAWCLVMFIANTIVLFYDFEYLTELLQLVQDVVPLDHRYRLGALAILHFVLAFIAEKAFFPLIAGAIRRKQQQKQEMKIFSLSEGTRSV